MATRVLVLGAGFGGLELSSTLSEALGDEVDVTLIDRNDAFVFGFSKLDLMFGHKSADSVRLPYRDIAKPGVRFLQQTVTAIDPETRTVSTDEGTTRLTSSSSHLAPTTTWPLHRDSPRPATSSTQSPVPSASPSCCRPSQRGTRSSAFAVRPSSARRHPARRRCSFTSTSRPEVSARVVRSHS